MSAGSSSDLNVEMASYDQRLLRRCVVCSSRRIGDGSAQSTQFGAPRRGRDQASAPTSPTTYTEELQRELGNVFGLGRVHWHQGEVLRGKQEFGAPRDQFTALLALCRELERLDLASNA